MWAEGSREKKQKDMELYCNFLTGVVMTTLVTWFVVYVAGEIKKMVKDMKNKDDETRDVRTKEEGVS